MSDLNTSVGVDVDFIKEIEVEAEVSVAEVEQPTAVTNGVPPDGKAGEVLTKNSSAPYDVSWQKLSDVVGGGLSEKEVEEIVSKKTKNLQPKTDGNLKTNSKEIVGAINELHDREDKQGLTEEQVKAVVRETAVTQESDPTVPAWAKQAKKPTYSYDEITDKPALFSGDYNDLSNKPTIPSTEGLATVKQLENLTDKTSELEEYSIREVSLGILEDNELSIEVKDKNGNVIATAETTLPTQDLSGLATEEYVDNLVGDINSLLGRANEALDEILGV